MLTERDVSRSIIIYTSTAPFLSIIQSLATLVYAAYKPLSPGYMIIFSLLMSVCWLVEWSLWMLCEIPGIGPVSAACFQIYLVPSQTSRLPLKSSTTLVYLRLFFSVIPFYAYLAQLGDATYMMHQKKIARRNEDSEFVKGATFSWGKKAQ